MDIYGKNEHRFDAIMDEYTNSNEYTQIVANFSQRPVTDTKVNNLNINFSNNDNNNTGYTNFSEQNDFSAANPNVPGTADVGPNVEATTTGLTLANSGSSGKVFDSYNKAFINKSNMMAHRNGGFIGPNNGLAATPVEMSENVYDLYNDLADAEEFGENYEDDFADDGEDYDDYDDYNDSEDGDEFGEDPYDDCDSEDYAERCKPSLIKKALAKDALRGGLVTRYVNGKPFREAKGNNQKYLNNYIASEDSDEPEFVSNPNFSEDFYEFMVTN